MSHDFVKEDVPDYAKRIGEFVINGSNNSTIILGTDRVDVVDSGYGYSKSNTNGKKAGCIYLVAGRKDTNPNMKDDLSFLYVSMISDIDKNLGTESAAWCSEAKASAALRSDCVRISARQDVKITIDGSDNYICIKKGELSIKINDASIKMKDGKVIIDAGKIELGEGATESVILGDTFINEYLGHIHSHPNGNTGTLLIAKPASMFKSRREVKVR